MLNCAVSVAKGNPPANLNEISELSNGYPATGSPLVSDFGKLIDSLAIVLLIILLSLLVILIFDAIRPWKHSRETIVQVMDLRAGNNQNDQAENAKPGLTNNCPIGNQALTELFAAKLRKIISTHDLAYQYCRAHFRNQEIYNSRTCADMTSVWSQVDIKSLFFEEPSRLAIGSSPFNDDLGQISSKVGPIEASFSLNGLRQFLQSRNTRNIHIFGSLQDYGDGPRFVSQLAYSKQYWAWDITDTATTTHAPKDDSKIPNLLEDLSYHVTNRIMGQTSQLIDVLPGDHFKNYSKLLSEFVTYIQSDTPELQKRQDQPNAKIQDNYKNLTKALKTFLTTEPTDVRSYYMLYIIGIIAIGRREYKDATDFLTRASIIEPSVVATVLRAGPSLRQLKWRQEIVQSLPRIDHQQNSISRPDRLRAFELGRGLANVNTALAYSLEQLLRIGRKCSKSESILKLEDAESAYQRAHDYKSNDPLLVSNLAEVKLKLSDSLQPKSLYDTNRLRLRIEAKQLLQKACRMKRHQHIKYAWLRMGHFQLRQGDLILAESYFQKAWDVDPGFLVAARNLANTFSMQGDYDEAIKICDKALREVGGNRNHYLVTMQIHGWIHNTRGWAYLRKARMMRKASSNQLIDKGTVSECKTWLKLAANDFEEAQILMDESDSAVQKPIPQLNKLFTSWEYLFFRDRRYSIDCFMEDLVKVLRSMPRESLFTGIYKSLLSESSKSFISLFEDHWRKQTFVPSEYLGLIADFQMLLDYVETLQGDHRYCVMHKVLYRLKKNVKDALREMAEYLPSCFLGLNYLWSGHQDRTKDCWKKRLRALKLDSNAEKSNELTAAALNHELWSALYQGLIGITSITSGDSIPSATVGRLPSFEKIYSSRRSPVMRQYALDLLAEAQEVGDILIRGYSQKAKFNWGAHSESAQEIHERKRTAIETRNELRKFFKPVRRRYYSALKQKYLLALCIKLRKIIDTILDGVISRLKTVGVWINIIFSPNL